MGNEKANLILKGFSLLILVLLIVVLFSNNLKIVSAEDPPQDVPPGDISYNGWTWDEALIYFLGWDSPVEEASLGAPLDALIGFYGTLTQNVMSLINYQYGSADLFVYRASTWQPSKTKQQCDLCNDESLFRYGCTEYLCKSLGTTCNFTNDAENDGACVTTQNDGLAPTIVPDESVLEDNYEYVPISEDVQFPQSGYQGVWINYTEDPKGEGCILPYTNLTLGFLTTKDDVTIKHFAHCKVDTTRSVDYESMFKDIDGGILRSTHSLLLPSYVFASATDILKIGGNLEDSKTHTFYFKCSDYNGNTNEIDFVMQFCVSQEPDSTSPVVTGYSYPNPHYVGYGKKNLSIEVYTNKPATCKWDFYDYGEYEKMQNDFDNCSKLPTDLIPGANKLGCVGNFTGVKEGESTNYYIICRDKPLLNLSNNPLNEFQIDSSTYSYVAIGSSPLVIDWIALNGKTEDGITITDSTTPTSVWLEAKTSSGVEEGYSSCYYSLDEDTKGFEFYDDGAYGIPTISRHNQTVNNVYPGEHVMYVTCEDVAGNVQKANLSFTVKLDENPPRAVRVYYEDGKLKLMTNEPSQCVYSTFGDCSFLFGDGTPMTDSESGLNHYVDWTTASDIFIKCKDQYENYPQPENNVYKCTAIVRGSEF